MATITNLSRFISGLPRDVDVSQNTLHLDSLKVGETTPSELSKAMTALLDTINTTGLPGINVSTEAKQDILQQKLVALHTKSYLSSGYTGFVPTTDNTSDVVTDYVLDAAATDTAVGAGGSIGSVAAKGIFVGTVAGASDLGKVLLRMYGSDNGIEDGTGDDVYGVLTESGGVYTLSYKDSSGNPYTITADDTSAKFDFYFVEISDLHNFGIDRFLTSAVGGVVDSTTADAVVAESASREDADSTLAANIYAEETDRIAADNAEAAARADADSTLQANIDAEATLRANADSSLESLIDAESTPRLAADSTLQANIDEEATTRENADSTLTANLNVEITARIDADTTLQANLDAEAPGLTYYLDYSSDAAGNLISPYNLDLGYEFAQTFKETSYSGPVSKVTIKLRSPGTSSGTAIMEIREVTDLYGDLSSGNLIATSQEVNLSGLPYTLTNIDFNFSTPFTLTGSQQYAFLLKSTTTWTSIQVQLATTVPSPQYATRWVDTYWSGLGGGNDIPFVFTMPIDGMRLAGDSDLQNAIDNEATARENADSTIQANIDLEIIAREDADSTLTANLNSEITSRENADSTLQANIDAEATLRANADTTLQASIDSEATTRANADTTLQTNIDAEATLRANADTTLQASIDSEVTTRENADSTLQASIDAEATTRANADVTIQASIDSEATLRANADTTLQASIDSEATTRANADVTLQASLDSEITARENSDSTLQANLDSEITARLNADSTLQAQLDAFNTSVVDVTFTAGANITAGDIVAESKTAAGTVFKADATSFSTCETVVGVATESKNTSEAILIRTFGEATVTTDGTNFDIGKRVYVHTTAGQGTKTAPSVDGNVLFVVGGATATNKVFVNLRLEYIIGDLLLGEIPAGGAENIPAGEELVIPGE